MTFAEGAAAVARSRQLALGDAAMLRRAVQPVSALDSSASPPADLTDLLALLVLMRGRADDPVHAQVVVDELGVNGIQGLLAELSARGRRPRAEVAETRDDDGLRRHGTVDDR